MSVVVKGMRMPENCEKCPFLIEEDIDFDICRQCGAGKNGYIHEADIDGFPADCPLVDLGKHGRLIDENEVRTVMNWLLTQPQRPTWNDLYHAIQEMNATVEVEDES